MQAICTTNEKTAEAFLKQVDSACVLKNCSTRFSDGFRCALQPHAMQVWVASLWQHELSLCPFAGLVSGQKWVSRQAESTPVGLWGWRVS